MKIEIHYEVMGGDWYYMLYRKRWLLRSVFWERCNTPETAKIRMLELTA